MDLKAFRAQVLATFGEDLHRASPASVRDFLDHLSQESPHDERREGGRFVIDETARSYEEVMRTFFARVLDLAPEQAVIQLWTVALELAYDGIASADADRLEHLFKGIEEPPA